MSKKNKICLCTQTANHGIFKKTICGIVSITLSISLLGACECPTTTFIPIHSQSFNSMRNLVGNLDHIYLPNPRQWYATFCCTPEYTKSFRPERITQCLFGTDIVKCKNTLTISGSSTKDRASSDWLADYFGLPTDFKSCVYFNPHVRNKLVDNYLYLGLDGISPGLFASLNAPIVQTLWDLKYTETVVKPGIQPYQAGYFTTGDTPRKNLLPNFTSFISGCQAPQLIGTPFHPLAYARMSPCERTFSSFSDLQLILGYMLHSSPSGHFELHARGAFPMGNRPRGDFLFEPIIGNGYRKELGGGVGMHWQHQEPDEHAAIRFDIQCDAVHLFETLQRRSFDLKGKPNSRYMLAQKMGSHIESGLTGPLGSETISGQFKNLFTPIANLTTCDIKVSNAAQIDFTFLFSYFTDSDSWSFGYGIWSCSPDNIYLCDTHLEPNTWALKGDSQVFGFEQNSNTPIALSATQSQADVHTGKNNGDIQNPGIDNPRPAFINHVTPVLATPSPAPAQQIKTSIQPFFINTSDIDVNSARSHGFANRIVSHFAHTWQSESVTGTFGFGCEVEFGMRHYLARKQSEPILNTALSYWGVWLKASLTFK